MMLTDFQIERYSRQILLAQVGGRGQESILDARIEVVGNGRAARTAARYLCAAGVGHLFVRCGADSFADHGGWELDNPDCTVAFSACEPDTRPDLVLHAGAGSGRDFLDRRCLRRLVGTAGNGQSTVIDAGRSCAPCAIAAEEKPAAGADGPLDEVAEFVTGTLLAQEALALLLAPERPHGRVVALGVADATASSRSSTLLPTCPHAPAGDG